MRYWRGPSTGTSKRTCVTKTTLCAARARIYAQLLQLLRVKSWTIGYPRVRRATEKYKGEAMNDPEVARLRRLRLAALRVRALAIAHGATRTAAKEPLFSRMACATWRIARVASGRLRAHPYARYQKDPSVVSLAGYRALAWFLALFGSNRVR